jgi:hypothetical protein
VLFRSANLKRKRADGYGKADSVQRVNSGPELKPRRIHADRLLAVWDHAVRTAVDPAKGCRHAVGVDYSDCAWGLSGLRRKPAASDWEPQSAADIYRNPECHIRHYHSLNQHQRHRPVMGTGPRSSAWGLSNLSHISKPKIVSGPGCGSQWRRTYRYTVSASSVGIAGAAFPVA